MLDTVELSDGVARIGFDARLPDAIPGASSAAGSRAVLEALDATATQFHTVDDVICSLEGDTDAFYNWLQLGSPS